MNQVHETGLEKAEIDESREVRGSRGARSMEVDVGFNVWGSRACDQRNDGAQGCACVRVCLRAHLEGVRHVSRVKGQGFRV